MGEDVEEAGDYAEEGVGGEGEGDEVGFFNYRRLVLGVFLGGLKGWGFGVWVGMWIWELGRIDGALSGDLGLRCRM